MKIFIYCGFLILTLLSDSLWACSFPPGLAPKQPTEEQWLAGAELAFLGKVVAVEPALVNGRRPGTYKFTLSVVQWIKGGEGAAEMVVFDKSPNPCDIADHLVSASDPRAVEWRVFAERRGTDYWVMTAHRQDRDWR